MNKWSRIKYHPNLPLGKHGERVTASSDHITLAKDAAKEGMVLLKNNESVLPFKTGTRLALFGKAVFDYVRGGGGSGEVTTAYSRDFYEGFKCLSSHVTVEESLADYYREYVREQFSKGNNSNWIVEPDIPDDLCVKARQFTDTAVIVFSRFSGEGWDRSVEDEFASEASQRSSAGREKVYENGDFYLSCAETKLVEKIKKYFTKIVVLLNISGPIDTEWFINDDRIQSVMITWMAGMEGGLAAAELLCGLGNPSGKLADTFAKKLSDYPSTKGFHESDTYIDYTEDIYVGYRYFETIPGAAQRVNYPFGYGLSYTDFSWKLISAQEADGNVSIVVEVSNIGSVAGKEVMQVYASAPQGLLGKPRKVLMDFKKTDLLEPGGNQLLTLQFSINDMASYDDLGKIAKAAYLLEKGEYTFHVGTSVRDTRRIDLTYSVEDNKVIKQLSPKLVPTSLKRRMLSNGAYEELPIGEPNDPDQTVLPIDHLAKYAGEMPAVRAVGRIPRRSRERKETLNFNLVAEGKQSIEEFVSLLSDDELAHLLGGQPNVGVANTWGFGNMPEYNIPNCMTADGPAGLRIKPECGIYTTAFPSATLLACTWNPEITFAVGEAGAKEVKENNLAVWLTPGVNIHRNPLCGRNFEYYSEDPYLAGVMASGMVKGIQSQNIAPSVKHFALNNKELNRKDSDSRVSERAAREVYLKVFEIIVKTANPWCIMTSYNIINGHRSSENRELIEDILRGEWGFDGMVCTDWWTYGEHYKEVHAGNDLKMATGYPERLLEAINLGVLTREEMVDCAKRILRLILKFD